MKERSRRTWLMLALLTYSLATALTLGLKSLQSNVSGPTETAAMQLQGAPAEDENSVAPDADEGSKTIACSQRDCLPPKVELAIVLTEETQPHESMTFEGKAFLARGDDIPSKSKD